jgi:hypothetical protein
MERRGAPLAAVINLDQNDKHNNRNARPSTASAPTKQRYSLHELLSPLQKKTSFASTQPSRSSSVVENYPALELSTDDEHIAIGFWPMPPIKLDKFANLWTLSLVGCSTLSTISLSALNKFAALGFLDLSVTNVTFVILQQSIRKLNILQLHVLQCEHILNPTPINDRIPPSKRYPPPTEEETQGFLFFVLPNVWSLNGIPVLFEERKRWGEYFAAGGKGQWSDLIRRHFVSFDSAFTPTREQRIRNFNGLDTAPETKEDSAITTPGAKTALSGMPLNVHMPVEQDMWRIKKLAKDLESSVIQRLGEATHGIDQVSHSTDLFLCRGVKIIAPKGIAPLKVLFGTMEARAILAILLFASLFGDLPVALIQSVLEVVFTPQLTHSERTKKHWTSPSVSPLFWRIQERLRYLGLLSAVLELDFQSGNYSSCFSDLI